MGKRQFVVISSSSASEGRDSSERRGLRSSKSKTRKSAPGRKSRNAKKARFSTPPKGSSGIEEVLVSRSLLDACWKRTCF